MPKPLASLLSVHFQLQTPEGLSEAEQHKLTALTAINHLGNLGLITQMLAPSKSLDALIEAPDHVRATQSDEIDAAFYVLGQLQSAIADHAYMAVEEMAAALKPKSKN